MRTCEESLLTVYGNYVAETGNRSAYLERQLPRDAPTHPYAGPGDARALYAVLFSDTCRSRVEDLFRCAVAELRGAPYDRCDDVLKGLEFIQELVSTAMWKHGCTVGGPLEAFAREFDRLDLAEERLRLHHRAQRGTR